MKKEIRNNKGFSLVELIVVIAIMAVLVGVLAPQFIKYVEKSRQSTDIQTADNVATAMKTYFTDKASGSNDHEVTLKNGNNPDWGSDNDVKTALEDVKLDTAQLRSSQWEIKVKSVGATGAIQYTTTAKGSGKVYYVANGTSDFTPE